MQFPVLPLFIPFLLLWAFDSSSDTALVAENPCRIEYPKKKGSGRAKQVRQLPRRVDTLLTAILAGNTLASTAAASAQGDAFGSEGGRWFMVENMKKERIEIPRIHIRPVDG